ncbi:hypothetical protein DB347_23110 [Opitutaceae bacterium EW11]|nr:hypothetical protein DB347_23110 [Opitutaceae bacterium EW11]
MNPSFPLHLSLAVALQAVVLLAGCAVGPDYRQPKLPGKPAERRAVASKPRPADTNTPSWWQAAGNPELARLVERSLADNRDLRVAFARLEESRALRREARASLWPAGSVSAGYRRQLDSTVLFKGVPRDLRDQKVFDVGVDAAWELDLFGRVRRSIEAGSASVDAAEADFAQLRLLIAAETARAFVEYRAARTLLDLRQCQLSAAEKMLAVLEHQVAEGKIGREQLASSEQDVATLKSAAGELRLAERGARNRLGVLSGDGEVSLSSDGAPVGLPAPMLTSDPIQLMAGRPDVQAAERRLAASTAAIGVARADYFPTVSLVGRVGAEANRLGDLTSADANFFSFGPRLTWDLLNLHRVQARVRASEARAREALAAWEQTVLLALEEIDNALARSGESTARLQERTRAALAAAEASRIVQDRFAEGLAGPLEALGAESAALGAQAERVRVEAELAMSRIALQQSVAAR